MEEPRCRWPKGHRRCWAAVRRYIELRAGADGDATTGRLADVVAYPRDDDRSRLVFRDHLLRDGFDDRRPEQSEPVLAKTVSDGKARHPPPAGLDFIQVGLDELGIAAVWAKRAVAAGGVGEHLGEARGHARHAGQQLVLLIGQAVFAMRG